MSVHIALRELEGLRDTGPTPADFAAQARHLSQLEALLTQQMAQGVQHIAKAGLAVEQVERRIGGAVDEFSRRLVQGEMSEVLNGVSRQGLAHEIAQLKEGAVRQSLSDIAESVQPLTQWAGEFQQAYTPHLESIRALAALAQRTPPMVLVVDG